MKTKITFDEYIDVSSKLEIRMGQIMGAEPVPKSFGLKLIVIFGPEESDVKTAFTNLGKTHKPEEFIGLICPFIMNLEPSVIKGVTSEVMIMVGEDKEGKLSLENYPVGSKLM